VRCAGLQGWQQLSAGVQMQLLQAGSGSGQRVRAFTDTDTKELDCS